jgi:hypothetical protein
MTRVVDSKPSDTTVRVSKDMARTLGIVAKHRGMSIAEYMDGVCKPWILQDLSGLLGAANEQVRREMSAK